MIKDYNKYISTNESKLNGKYGFFIFLDVIDELKNSFIKENYLNVRNYNIFFTTDNIKDKNKLTDLLEFKKSLDVAYQTLIHIRNLRLSFYFAVSDYNLEYGFHDDLKRMVYKIGEFRITSKFLNSLSSYKSITLISKVLQSVKLRDLELLQKVKTDIKYLFDKKFNEIDIIENNIIIKKINNTELKNYYDKDNITEYFDSWCFKHKWYYNTYNYTDVDDNNTYFYVKVKENDETLSLLKKNDIRNIKKLQENIDDDLKHVDQTSTEQPEIYEPMNREPLESPKLKLSQYKKDKNSKTLNKEEKQKELIKYYKALKKVIVSINKDTSKNKTYLTKYLYKIVGEYKKPFDDVKKDLQWLVYKLRENPEFIEEEELTNIEKINKKKEVEKKKKANASKKSKKKK